MTAVPLNLGQWSPWTYKEAFEGYQKISINVSLPRLQTSCDISFGKIQRQSIQRQGDVVLGKMKVLLSKDLAKSGAPFHASVETPCTPVPLATESYLVEALEEALSRHRALNTDFLDLVICSAHHPQRRSALGLPAEPLVTSERLLATRRHVPGIHSSLVSLSPGQSFGFTYKEEADLQSTTILWRGNSIIWVVISPRHSAKLESRLVDHLDLQHRCSQFVRHEDIIIPPSTLKAWGIDFSIFIQQPGDVVRTDHQAYRYTWNMGPNVSERVSCCEMDWIPPPMYIYCRKKCRPSAYITATDLEITEPHPLEVCETSDERSENGEVGVPHRDRQPSPYGSIANHERPGNSLTGPVDTRGRLGEATGKGRATSSASELFIEEDVYSMNNQDGISSDDDGASCPSRGIRTGLMDLDTVPYESTQTLFFPSHSECSVTGNSPPNHWENSPDSEFFISTDYQSGRRLPQTAPVGMLEDDVTNGSSGSDLDEPSDDEQPESQQVADTPSLVTDFVTRGEHPYSLLRSGNFQDLDSVAPAVLEGPLVQALSLSSPTTNHISSVANTPVASELREGDGPYLTPPSTVKLPSYPGTTFPPPNQEVINLIEELIKLGIQQREAVAWKTIAPEGAENALTKFRPGEWLNDDAVMETLYRMASNRDDVHVVECHDFAAAYSIPDPARICRWRSPSIVLIPVHMERISHWFLISVDFECRQIVIHENKDTRYTPVEKFVSSALSKFGTWTVEYRGVSNDGDNCGIILLKEAETILKPSIEDVRNFNLLRAHYLAIVLEDVVTRSNNDVTGSESPMPNAAPHRPVLMDSGKHEGQGETLIPRFFASAVDREELFQDFRAMVDVLRHSPREGGSSNYITLQLYNYVRDHQKDLSGKSSLTTDSNVKMAVQLFNQDEGVNSGSLENGGLRDSLPTMDADVKVALKLYKQARGYKMLGVFQKDIAALYICIRHGEFMDEYQAAANERKRIKRRKRVPDAEESTGAPGVGGDSHAYDMLKEISSETKENLKRIKSRGAHLLQYEATYGPTHPLWILLPAEGIRYHKDASGQPKYATYRTLNKTQTRSLVDLVVKNYPRFWEYLPRFQEVVIRALRGEEVDLHFIEELENQAFV